LAYFRLCVGTIKWITIILDITTIQVFEHVLASCASTGVDGGTHLVFKG
jgi:hypothetical protein